MTSSFTELISRPRGEGTGLILVGDLAWVTAFVLPFQDPAKAFSQKLTPGGSMLMSIGMLLVGVSVLGSQRASGVGRWIPIMVGLYFPAQLIFQIVFFLDGQDSDAGPNGAILGVWGLLWTTAACASCFTGRKLSVIR